MSRAEDIMRRHGDFFTPKVVVDRAVEYLTKTLGSDWQDKYYIWDCCCGTGNLLQDLKRQDRIFASSLKRCHIRLIQTLGRLKNTPSNHLFQMDFLNDDWKPVSEGGKIPNDLWDIIKHQPDNLLIFINPPYAEATKSTTASNNGINRHQAGTSMTKIKDEVGEAWGASSNELFIQFYFRIYKEIKGCILGCFSTLKNIQGYNFIKYRNNFKAKFKGGYLFPAQIFDNVSGKFPISFQIWNIDGITDFPREIKFDVFDLDYRFLGEKGVLTYQDLALINDWFLSNNQNKEKLLGGIMKVGNDFQHYNYLFLYPSNKCSTTTHNNNNITSSNLITSLLYLSVRTSIPATWLNDRDQFTAPYFEEIETEEKVEDNDKNLQNNKDKTKKVKHKHYLYENDQDFINNCIIYALFTKNNTDWCLFDNDELGLEYSNRNLEVWNLIKQELSKASLTNEALAVYNTAKELYIYYHKNKCGKGSNVVVNNVTNNNSFDAVVYNLRSDIQHSNYLQIQNNSNTNNKTNFYNPLASWQDVLNAIKGVKVDKSGKASRCTKCEAYPEMRETIEQLSLKLKSLAKKIEEGVYKYGFLR